MTRKLLKNVFLTLAFMASGYSYAQSLNFDSVTITIDTQGIILGVDGSPFDAVTNPIKFSQVDMTSDSQAMFCTLRRDWIPTGNWNGGTVISSSNNTSLSPGTSTGNAVMGPGAVPASQFINLTEMLTTGQDDIFVVLRKRVQTGPNQFAGAGLKVTIAETLSINDNTIKGIRVYPNPAKDYVTINTHQGGDFKLFNILGALVKSESAVSREYTMDVSGLQGGVYLLRIASENTLFTQKIVID